VCLCYSVQLVCVCVTVYSWCVSVLQCTVGVCLCYSVQSVCVCVTVYSRCVSVLQCTNLSPEAAQGRLGLVSQKENCYNLGRSSTMKGRIWCIMTDVSGQPGHARSYGQFFITTEEVCERKM